MTIEDITTILMFIIVWGISIVFNLGFFIDSWGPPIYKFYNSKWRYWIYLIIIIFAPFILVIFIVYFLFIGIRHFIKGLMLPFIKEENNE